MRPHLTMEQQQPVLRLKAKGLPLREICPPAACSHQGAALIVALPPGGGPPRWAGAKTRAAALADREITPGSPDRGCHLPRRSGPHGGAGGRGQR